MNLEFYRRFYEEKDIINLTVQEHQGGELNAKSDTDGRKGVKYS
jgi:hypothetical protein